VQFSCECALGMTVLGGAEGRGAAKVLGRFAAVPAYNYPDLERTIHRPSNTQSPKYYYAPYETRAEAWHRHPLATSLYICKQACPSGPVLWLTITTPADFLTRLFFFLEYLLHSCFLSSLFVLYRPYPTFRTNNATTKHEDVET
jgi:hypothetical protein